MMNLKLIFISSIRYLRERTQFMSFRYIGLYSDIYRLISFKLGMVIETAKLCVEYQFI